MKKVHPVFDNDGTLWAEQPMYFRLLFTLDCLKALAPRHPEWKDKEPFAWLGETSSHAAKEGIDLGDRANG
jgi:phosphoglycolate phosphatase-like HAD superfamily hydrolase